MAGYKFHAIDNDGRVSQGVLEEDSPRQARQTLRERGLIPLEVDLVETRAASARTVPIPGRGGVSVLQLALLTRQLSTLVSAGLTVETLRFTNPIGLLGWIYNAHISKTTEHTSGQVRLYENLVAPWALPLDRLVPPPIGLSLFAVGRAGATRS